MTLKTLVGVAALGLVAACAAVSWGEPPQVLLYAESSDRNEPLVREQFSGLWTGAVGQDDADADIRRVSLAVSPIAERVAGLVQTRNGTLQLCEFRGSLWGNTNTLHWPLGDADLPVADLAYESQSGELMIAHRRFFWRWVYVKRPDDAWWLVRGYNFGLGSAPTMIRTYPSPDSNDVLIVATNGSTLSAGVWNGSSVDRIVTLDSAYASGVFDAAYETGSGEAVVLWARGADTSPRMRTLDADGWSGELSGPAIGVGCDAITLAPDNEGDSDAIVAAIAGGGRAFASDWDGEAWSTAQQLTDALTGSGALAVAFEPEDGAAVAVWQETGRDDLFASRWDGGMWSPGAASGSMNGVAREIEAVARDSGDAVIAVVRSEVVTGEPYSAYTVYSDGGGLSFGGVTVESGLTGHNQSGVDLPDAPGISAGWSDKSYGNNATGTLAPGRYDELSVGNNVTLNLSAGRYAFEKFESEKNGTHFACDTSGGDVEFVVTNSDVKVKNNFTISNTGGGGVTFHVKNGNFEAKNGATIQGALVVHNGNIKLGNSADVDGHVFGSGNIEIGGGSVSLPSWSIPGGSTSTGQELHAVAIVDGLPGSAVEITTDWSESYDLPFAVSQIPPTSSGGVSIVRWREVDPDQ